MHQIQINIITNLAFVRAARYSELKPIEMEGSQFTYHLDDLISQELIEKSANGDYSLTAKGKQFANTLNIKIAEVSKRNIVSTIFCGLRNEPGTEAEYLLYTKKRHPFIGCQGFPTSRVHYGESVEQAATRGMLEQAGLVGKPQLVHIFHSVVMSENNQPIDDFVLFTYIFPNPTGELKACEIGDFSWVKESELKTYVQKPVFKFFEIQKKIKDFNGTIGFTEFKDQDKYY